MTREHILVVCDVHEDSVVLHMEDEPLNEERLALVAIGIFDPCDDPTVMEVSFGKFVEAALPPITRFADVQLEPWSQPAMLSIYMIFLHSMA